MEQGEQLHTEVTHLQQSQGWLEIPEALPEVSLPPSHYCSPVLVQEFAEANVQPEKAEQKQPPLRERVTENLNRSLPLPGSGAHTNSSPASKKVCLGAEL